MVLLEKLKLAAVGNRPIIFVCHSFGGIITKQILKYASEWEACTRDSDWRRLTLSQEYRAIRDASRGIVFFGTPHFGSELSAYGTGYADIIVRPNPVLTDLSNVKHLKQLNDEVCS